jgi:hypothetical protein
VEPHGRRDRRPGNRQRRHAADVPARAVPLVPWWRWLPLEGESVLD